MSLSWETLSYSCFMLQQAFLLACEGDPLRRGFVWMGTLLLETGERGSMISVEWAVVSVIIKPQVQK